MTNSAPSAASSRGTAFFELSNTPMAVLDEDLRVQAANPAWTELARRPTEILSGRRLSEALPDDATTERPFAVEDGARWLRVDLQPTRGQTLALLVDVTAEHLQLKSLQVSNEIRDQLLSDAMVGTWRYDPDTQIFYFATALDLGWGLQESTDMQTVTRVQHREDQAADAAARDEITRHGGAAEREIRYRHSDGSWRHLLVQYRAGRRLPSGLYEVHGLSQNITAQARARDEAKAAAQRLSLALRGAGAAVFEYDFGAGHFWGSPELRTMVGPDLLAAGGEDPLVMFCEDDRPAVADVRRRSARGEVPEPIDVRLRTIRGERWMRLHLEVEQGRDGRARRAVGLLLDIETQKRQALALAEARQVAEEATAAKSEFLASVSHEIRTPMNGIVGVMNLLRREPLSEEARQLLAEAIACSDMLGQLINDVLDFSKIEAGKLEIAPAATDAAQIAHSVASLIRPQAEARGLELRTRIAPDIGWLSLDPVRLRQCLFNLLGNAVKFTETGHVELRMGLVGEAGARRLRCEIEDTGIGIAKAAQERLFDRFTQAEAGVTTRRYGGTGLGLAISRTLARLMGGDMGFSSVEGQGSTFWFEIEAIAAQGVEAYPEADEAGASLAGLRLLVVDDNATNRLVGGKTLEALGAETVAVDSGEAAIAAVAQSQFDLVLMDVNMPGMDGLEATRRIRALPVPAKVLPIIAMTADVMGHHRQRYFEAGMDGLVPKPFSPGQLLGEIVRVLTEELSGQARD